MQCCTVQYTTSNLQCSAVRFNVVQYNKGQCRAVEGKKVQLIVVWSNDVQCSAVQCSAVQCRAVDGRALQYSADRN